MKYKRILLKLSGGALGGSNGENLARKNLKTLQTK